MPISKAEAERARLERREKEKSECRRLRPKGPAEQESAAYYDGKNIIFASEPVNSVH